MIGATRIAIAIRVDSDRNRACPIPDADANESLAQCTVTCFAVRELPVRLDAGGIGLQLPEQFD